MNDWVTVHPMKQPCSGLGSSGVKRVALCIVSGLCPLVAIAVSCTSSDEEPATSGETVMAEASMEATATTTVQRDAGNAQHQETGPSAPDGARVTSPEQDGGAVLDGASNGKDAAQRKDAIASSDACAAYCACYEKKCSVFVAIPTGQDCPDFCATFEKDKTKYDCRFNMCFYNSNGPAQNNNNHCQHTVGIDECL
jgi:hypothetical protein